MGGPDESCRCSVKTSYEPDADRIVVLAFPPSFAACERPPPLSPLPEAEEGEIGGREI